MWVIFGLFPPSTQKCRSFLLRLLPVKLNVFRAIDSHVFQGSFFWRFDEQFVHKLRWITLHVNIFDRTRNVITLAIKIFRRSERVRTGSELFFCSGSSLILFPYDFCDESYQSSNTMNSFRKYWNCLSVVTIRMMRKYFVWRYLLVYAFFSSCSIVILSVSMKGIDRPYTDKYNLSTRDINIYIKKR